MESVRRADTATFIQCHVNAFEYLGGVPGSWRVRIRVGSDVKPVFVRPRAPGFRIKSGKTEERSEMTGVSCGSTPRTWVPAFAGKTEEGPEMTGDDGGYVRFRAPHLGSGLRRKDGGGAGDDGG